MTEQKNSDPGQHKEVIRDSTNALHDWQSQSAEATSKNSRRLPRTYSDRDWYVMQQAYKLATLRLGIPYGDGERSYQMARNAMLLYQDGHQDLEELVTLVMTREARRSPPSKRPLRVR